ncbi:MAG TPA: DUF2461 domain-containing protein [Bacteroidales bacterium]|nr:DUF2461 domain-containing protein [Bacteroidales bacterium]HRW94238.1 DUF2461 domain-containing protein [Bacteroidales bacterium]
MKQVIDFLTELNLNNNKEWFDSHKDQYLNALKEFHAFTEQLIQGIASFHKEITTLSVKDCTYRIYRDLRFSPDKTPYKTHMGAYICPGGKKSGYAGYYFHLEPRPQSTSSNHFLASGLWHPAPDVLKSVRDDILYDSESYLESVRLAKEWIIDYDESLKRVPRGYPSNSKDENLFRLRNHLLARNMEDKYIYDKNLLKNVLSEFKKTYTFVALLNRSVTYAVTPQN